MSNLPQCLAKMPNLKKLDMGANELTNLREVPILGNNLTELSLDQNKLRQIHHVSIYTKTF